VESIKVKPPLIEYRLDPVTGRCHENQIYKSTKGLGQVVTFLPYKAIPFSECGFDMSQPTIGYSLSPLGSQCLRAKIYMSKTGQGELRIPDGRATLADCGFDMRHPTQTIYEWKVPGMSCRKKLIFTSKIVKSELTRFSSKDVSVVDCTRNSTTPEAPSTARGTRAN
jgi:hypothetical protein